MGIELQVVDPSGDDAIWAMAQYFAEIDDRFAQGFDPGDALTSTSRPWPRQPGRS